MSARDQFMERWAVHLKRCAILKGYKLYDTVDMMLNPLVDHHLPPLLVLQAMELYDQAQKIVLDEREDITPNRHTLGGRARALHNARVLNNGEKILNFIQTRNAIAHELSPMNWNSLQILIEDVHAELHHLGFNVGEFPNYNVLSRLQRIECPYCSIHQICVVMLLQNDIEIEEVDRWEIRVGETQSHEGRLPSD
jgi:hypothetical protein